MSNRDEYTDIIKNQDTMMWRAWIDRALHCVRHRLEKNGDEPILVHEQPAERPALYVVHSVRKR